MGRLLKGEADAEFVSVSFPLQGVNIEKLVDDPASHTNNLLFSYNGKHSSFPARERD